MSEIEQLRKEVNELRERLAKLEAQHPRVVGPAMAGLQWQQPPAPQPMFVDMHKMFPPGTVLC